jgi:hypothetical protein
MSLDIEALGAKYGERNPILRTLFFVNTTIAMGFQLLAVCNATFCTLFGPGKGLLFLAKALPFLSSIFDGAVAYKILRY